MRSFEGVLGGDLRMSRSFHCPGPAFCPRGAAKSIIRVIAQSNSRDEIDHRQVKETRDEYVAVISRNPGSLQSSISVHGHRSSKSSNRWNDPWSMTAHLELKREERPLRHLCLRTSSNYSQLSNLQSAAFGSTVIIALAANRRKVPWLIFTPIAHRIQDRAPCRVQCARHLRVPVERKERRSALALVVTIVIL